jgi:hypothetical protein
MTLNRILFLIGCLGYTASFGQDFIIEQPELIYSVTQDKISEPKEVVIRNKGLRSRVIRNVSIVGIDADAFRIMKTNTMPIRLAPQETVSFPVQFDPAGESGFLNATLQINGANPKRNAVVKLYGLSAEGLEGENEPSLHYIVLTLGHAVEIGTASLKLGTDNELIGEELLSPRFVKSGKGEVSLTPVARYSPPEPVPFGFYTSEADSLQVTEIGVLSGEPMQHQTLYPALASGGTRFDPGNAQFGLFTQTSSHRTHTDDKLNTGLAHAVRVYPLRDRRGDLIDNKYLICFEEAENGDYQDFVFILSNVKPAFMAE